jgi:hypothetical protein
MKTKQERVVCISTIVIQFVYRQRTASVAADASKTPGQKLAMPEYEDRECTGRQRIISLLNA